MSKPKTQPRLALRAPGQRQLVPLPETQIDMLDRRLGTPNPDAEMGQQLTEQYHRATGGMVEVLKFGAMMMMLETTLETRFAGNESARGLIKSNAGRGSKGEGIKGWLHTHAPDVRVPTAYRFMHVAEAIAAESYAQLVGAKVAKQLALQDLVTTPAESLSPALQKKQADLFDFVSGTSQRSWLDRFKPEHTPGGKTYDRTDGKGDQKPQTPEEALAHLRALIDTAAKAARAIAKEKAYAAIEAGAALDAFIDDLTTALTDAKAWRKLTAAQREEALADLVAKHAPKKEQPQGAAAERSETDRGRQAGSISNRRTKPKPKAKLKGKAVAK